MNKSGIEKILFDAFSTMCTGDKTFLALKDFTQMITLIFEIANENRSY